MNVSQLIEELGKMPQHAKVAMIWDGASRNNVDNVWLARSGDVLLCEKDEVVYYDHDRPESAPTEEEEPHWRP